MAGAGDATVVTFPRHRGVAPMLWVLLALSSIASIAGVAWIVRLILSLRTRPPHYADGVLTMRAGGPGAV